MTSPSSWNITTDDSGLFTTYKREGSENTSYIPPLCWLAWDTVQQNSQKSIFPPIPEAPNTFQKNVYFIQMFFHTLIKISEVIINGGVRTLKIAVWWSIACGALFIASLATNTWNQAIDILQNSLESKFGIEILRAENSEKKVAKETQENKTNLSSNALQNIPTKTTTNTEHPIPSEIIEKRKAIIEARKAAKTIEERQNISQQIQ